MFFCFFYRMLFSIDRRNGVEEARDTVELAERYMKFSSRDHHVKVVGIDLSGDPSVSLLKACNQTDVDTHCLYSTLSDQPESIHTLVIV